jgi:Tfp pilus assembly protein PilV
MRDTMRKIRVFFAGKARGTSLLEVLIAMGILALMMVGTLQMFFVTLDMSRNSSNRTLLTYKAQQVAEQIRYIHYVAQQYGTSQIPSWASSTMGLGQTMTQGTYSLPYTSTDLADTTIGGPYWGPASLSYPQGMNIIEGAQMPYKLSYAIATNTQSNTWTITVMAQPVQTSSSAAQAGTNLYRGTNLTQKVKYVFSIPQ